MNAEQDIARTLARMTRSIEGVEKILDRIEKKGAPKQSETLPGSTGGSIEMVTGEFDILEPGILVSGRRTETQSYIQEGNSLTVSFTAFGADAERLREALDIAEAKHFKISVVDPGD